MPDSSEQTHYHIEELVRDQVSALESATKALDAKSGTFLGLLGVFLAIASQAPLPNTSAPGDLFFTYLSFGLLVSAVLLLALSMRPKTMRFDPDPAKLRDSCWDLEKDAVSEAVVANLVETWRCNRAAHEAKAKLQHIALWIATAGFVLFTLTILIFRPFFI